MLKIDKEPKEIEDTQLCFVIMPISDHADYSKGHFLRVYEHIIKPACELAGFKSLRADEVKSTNLIALDIVKQIIDCEMCICDLSSRNPNVLYEVGIRQAFNLPVTFIKDHKTERIFDIQGFRDVQYDETLRIDTVEQEIAELAETIRNTFENKNEVNSLVTLLGIEPAKISTTKISAEAEIILSSLRNIEKRISNLEVSNEKTSIHLPFVENVTHYDLSSLHKLTLKEISSLKIGSELIHERFGLGRVLEIKNRDTDKTTLVIFFEKAGKKELMARFANLFMDLFTASTDIP